MSQAPWPHSLIRASAGSGKTHQLTNRYLGLLAGGMEPDSILATTFTRKAAGEILDRVLKRLAEAADDANLAEKLAQQIQSNAATQRDFVALLRRTIRQLHRVRIGTLDSFHVSVAGNFALELGLPAGWSIIEEAVDQALREEALERLLDRDDAEILYALFRRLTHGESKRGVRDELLRIVKDLYEVHQETAADCWRMVEVPPRLTDAELEQLLSAIEAFDLSQSPTLEKPRREDLERARAQNWDKVITTGMCKKVFECETVFSRKPIPEALIALYRRLIDHAAGALIEPLAVQNEAAREFLDSFRDELWSLKQIGGGLRFNEVTQSLRAAIDGESMRGESLAFRLNGAVDHLLLDEFQDTSLSQWQVLRPIAQAITSAKSKSSRSFFCVGDVKQAIYFWRGGLPAIFDTLPSALGPLDESPLDVSRRSAQAIIDVVNQVFGKLSLPGNDKCAEAFAAWQNRFVTHSTVKASEPGYVCLGTGPAQCADDNLEDHRIAHCHYVAGQIDELRKSMNRPCSIGVLCRTNDAVARVIYELRQRKIDASEEGGRALDDSPAVELLLSLFTLADHPGHSIAQFHLRNSPLLEHVSTSAGDLRRELLAQGYGEFAHKWAVRLASVCDRRDRGRLQQFVEMAYEFQERSTLRAADFVNWVRDTLVRDPSAANVRVMTMHGAKGLEFDAVVLPQLDPRFLAYKTPPFVVAREVDTLAINFVCRYANESLQQMLPEQQRAAFVEARQKLVEESLSLLYVAMTRARHALYLFMPGKRIKNESDPWYKLLVNALAPEALEKPLPEKALLFETGDANWHALLGPATSTAAPVPSDRPISFRAADKERRRGFDHAAPSRSEGGGIMPLARLFNPSDAAALEIGSLHHAWFATIGWLDDGMPTLETLRDAASKIRSDLSPTIWRDLDRHAAEFLGFLGKPEIRALLMRSAYAQAPLRVECERRFDVREGDTMWTGSLDRIVWFGDAAKVTGADIIDFKTDVFDHDDSVALAKRTEFYRPQLQIYRRAIACMSGLAEKCISARLAFVGAGRVVDV